jgi:hypothetical protein
MKLKIISDGTERGTKIIDDDTGEELKNAYKVIWAISVRSGIASAKIYLHKIPVEIVGEGEVKINPLYKEDI